MFPFLYFVDFFYHSFLLSPQMVEAGSQLNYALTTKVLTTNKTVIIDGRSIAGISNATGGSSASTTGASTTNIDTSNDFNLIAANCNTNVCFFCQVSV